jgi:hypothetical protein
MLLIVLSKIRLSSEIPEASHFDDEPNDAWPRHLHHSVWNRVMLPVPAEAHHHHDHLAWDPGFVLMMMVAVMRTLR